MEALLKLPDNSRVPTPLTVSRHPNLDRIEQLLVAERLGQKLDGSRLHRPHAHGDVAVTGDEDDRQMDIGAEEIALEVEPAQAGQPDIEHKATWHVRPIALQEFLRRSV